MGFLETQGDLKKVKTKVEKKYRYVSADQRLHNPLNIYAEKLKEEFPQWLLEFRGSLLR